MSVARNPIRACPTINTVTALAPQIAPQGNTYYIKKEKSKSKKSKTAMLKFGYPVTVATDGGNAPQLNITTQFGYPQQMTSQYPNNNNNYPHYSYHQQQPQQQQQQQQIQHLSHHHHHHHHQHQPQQHLHHRGGHPQQLQQQFNQSLIIHHPTQQISMTPTPTPTPQTHSLKQTLNNLTLTEIQNELIHQRQKNALLQMRLHNDQRTFQKTIKQWEDKIKKKKQNIKFYQKKLGKSSVQRLKVLESLIKTKNSSDETSNEDQLVEMQNKTGVCFFFSFFLFVYLCVFFIFILCVCLSVMEIRFKKYVIIISSKSVNKTN